MYLCEAVDQIRDKLIELEVAQGAKLWPTVLKQIRKSRAFDGAHAETMLDVIRAFVDKLDDATAISLWRDTETGMADDAADDELFGDCVRMALEMELLHELTELAYMEAGRR